MDVSSYYLLIYLEALVLGCCVGSFLNVVHLRLAPRLLAWQRRVGGPKHWRGADDTADHTGNWVPRSAVESGGTPWLLSVPSSCPRCRQPILKRDNVPVLSWLWLRGRSRCCAEAISPRYPLVELGTGLATWLVSLAVLADGGGFWRLGLSWFALWLLLALIGLSIETAHQAERERLSGEDNFL